jgi:hypothetical protein
MTNKPGTTKARVRTGEKRKANQPFHIDRLPAAVQDAILYLKNMRGKTLEEIVGQSAEKFNEAWKSKGGGFIDWEKLDAPVRKLFPKKRLVLSSLHRWIDVRYDQVRADILMKSEQARILAESFANSMLVNGNDAVVNAARDTIMNMLADNSSAGNRQAASAGLIALAEVMQKARANDIRERKVSTEERKIKLLEEREAIQRQKLEREARELERKHSKGELKREDIAKLVEMTFGIAPQKPSQAA